jgi:hypothetical protein
MQNYQYIFPWLQDTSDFLVTSFVLVEYVVGIARLKIPGAHVSNM